MIVAGTRPEIIKLAPVIKWLEKLGEEYIFVWSGQHYDYELSRIFFEQLRIPEPDEDLNVGSGTHAEQTAKMMVGLERLIQKYSPAIVVAEGDTNTVVASSLTALKCLVPFAHVEAGLRSWNMSMPEEVNRKIADALASVCFAPTKLAVINLLFEGVSRKFIHLTGNTIVDVVYEYKEYVMRKGDETLARFDLDKYDFILVTLHRAENTVNRERLRSILAAFSELSEYYRIVFPMHPRTRNAIVKFGLGDYLKKIEVLDPLGYLEFLGLLANSRVVLTDSGGVQEESLTLKVPTVTLRYNTERPETTMFHVNVLAGADKDRIVKLALMQAERAEKIRRLSFENPFGDGYAGKRITQILKEALENRLDIKEPDLRETPAIEYRLLEEDCLENSSLFDLLVAFDGDGRPILSESGTLKFLARIKGRFNDKGSFDSK